MPSDTRTGIGRTAVILSLLLLVLLVAAVLRMLVGGVPQTEAQAIYTARWFRVCEAVIVGVALATAGVALQALLRNPLAEPFILGLSSGAAVGVMAQTLIQQSAQQIFGARYVGAMLGAAVSMAIVYAAGRRRGVIDPLGLLLTGVVLSTLNGAVMLLLSFIDGRGLVRDSVARWMMGYLDEGLSRDMVITVAVITGLGLGILLYFARQMDAATFSDSEAHGLGVNLRRLRTILFAVSAILAGGAVVLAGPIAFVGLICPHIVRLLLGPRHRALLLGSALTGATLIVVADVIARETEQHFNYGLLPIGIFTSMIGGPLFLWMLRPHLGRT